MAVKNLLQLFIETKQIINKIKIINVKKDCLALVKTNYYLIVNYNNIYVIIDLLSLIIFGVN